MIAPKEGSKEGRRPLQAIATELERAKRNVLAIDPPL
ncbi:hypothetical protein ACVIWV_009901 [Bradyrhizobium diazoefficiens]